MKAAETNIDTLLNGIKHFRVPLYQRTYSWGKDQWQALWDAIVDQAEAVADDDSAPGHFLGSVVLAPGPGTAAMPVWVVIDGRQRLTTLSLALAALRDHVRGEDERRAEYVHEDYLINRRASGNERLKLLPTQADRAAYLACIEGSAHAGAAATSGRRTASSDRSSWSSTTPTTGATSNGSSSPLRAGSRSWRSSPPTTTTSTASSSP